jgi:hypothetical protein
VWVFLFCSHVAEKSKSTLLILIIFISTNSFMRVEPSWQNTSLYAPLLNTFILGRKFLTFEFGGTHSNQSSGFNYLLCSLSVLLFVFLLFIMLIVQLCDWKQKSLKMQMGIFRFSTCVYLCTSKLFPNKKSLLIFLLQRKRARKLKMHLVCSGRT